MLNFTPELIEKARAAKTVEELIAIAKDNNVELTEEEAKTYFEQLHANGAVTDDELDQVAGGGECNDRVFLTIDDLPNGTLVMLKRDKCCSNCGPGVPGYSRLPNPDTNQASIWCTKCRQIILMQVEESDFFKI